MNENVDLTKILKNCPKGTKLYSTIQGEITFDHVDDNNKDYPIVINCIHELIGYAYDGRFDIDCDGECILFPSKDKRDWSKFTAPWYKKERFDPKTLQPFDKVLVRNIYSEIWSCGFFSHMVVFNYIWKYNVGDVLYVMCIPYNDDTKHLLGTTDEAPEYYRYWEE